MKFWPKFLTVLLLLFISINLASAEPVVKVGESSGAVGETASVSINVKNAENIGSMDLAIAYDPEILKVVKVEKGSLVKGLFSSNTKRAGIIAIGIVDSKGINGDGEVAKITFQVLKAGESKIEIVSVKAYDVESHVDVKVTAESGVFKAEEKAESTQSTPTPVSTPAKKSPGFELGIAAIGLMLALLWRRKGS